MKAFVLAAGLGTRLKPWTDHHPKALAMVNGKSLLQRNIEYLQQAGIREVVVNVHHFAQQIIDAIEENQGWGSTVQISDETDAVLETGGGLVKAQPFFAGETDFVVMNADILTDLDLNKMIQHHLQSGALATLATTQRESSRYFLFDVAERLSGWTNTKTGEEKIMREPSPLHPAAFSGVHVINTQLFQHILRTGKFSMVDVYLDICAEQIIKGYDHTGGLLLDVGKPESLEKAASIFQ